MSMGYRLKNTKYRIYIDLPAELVKRRKELMNTLRTAKRRGQRANFSKSEPDKLYIDGKFWPVGKPIYFQRRRTVDPAKIYFSDETQLIPKLMRENLVGQTQDLQDLNQLS